MSLDKLKEADARYATLYKKAQERVVLKNRSDASRFNLALICVKWSTIRQRLTGEPAEAQKLQTEADVLVREILRDRSKALDGVHGTGTDGWLQHAGWWHAGWWHGNSLRASNDRSHSTDNI